jgi:hypothetical protein
MCTRGTRACICRLDFQSKIFSYAIFIVKKGPLYVNFSIPLCAKWRFLQGSISLVDMRFCWHVTNSPRNKNLKSLNPYLPYKMVFWPPKLCCTPWAHEKKLFLKLWTLWSCKRYGMNGYDLVDMFIKLVTRSYNWKYKRKPQFCTICLAFKRGFFEAVLDSMRPLMFRG